MDHVSYSTFNALTEFKFGANCQKTSIVLLKK